MVLAIRPCLTLPVELFGSFPVALLPTLRSAT